MHPGAGLWGAAQGLEHAGDQARACHPGATELRSVGAGLVAGSAARGVRVDRHACAVAHRALGCRPPERRVSAACGHWHGGVRSLQPAGSEALGRARGGDGAGAHIAGAGAWQRGALWLRQRPCPGRGDAFQRRVSRPSAASSWLGPRPGLGERGRRSRFCSGQRPRCLCLCRCRMRGCRCSRRGSRRQPGWARDAAPARAAAVGRALQPPVLRDRRGGQQQQPHCRRRRIG
mmetsp:Transcript_14190/g.53780  ORF Transcript_14190/g.53780 Transcript_14190/m.53780 type:complete len:232 (+) Transcript_14190:300-995(+)